MYGQLAFYLLINRNTIAWNNFIYLNLQNSSYKYSNNAYKYSSAHFPEVVYIEKNDSILSAYTPSTSYGSPVRKSKLWKSLFFIFVH